MDSERFENLVRALASARSRRGVLGSSLAGLLTLFVDERAAAKKKRRRSCRAVRCVECTKCRRGRCKPLPDGTECSDGGECRDGVCVR
jgi:hypothetical protein